ncbi:MAG: cobalamin-dependent protein [Bacillota bacterium]
MSERVEQFQDALLSSNPEKAEALLKEGLSSLSILECIEEVVMPALDNIGAGWEKGEYALSQVYMSGRICEDLLDRHLPSEDALRNNKPRMAIALLNDYHSLGKKIIYSALRAAGYNLLDYGRVEAEELVRRAEEDQLELLLISVLMYSSALKVADVVKGLKMCCPDVVIAVGGAPFRLDRSLWQDVGADYVGTNSGDAFKIVRSYRGADQDE